MNEEPKTFGVVWHLCSHVQNWGACVWLLCFLLTFCFLCCHSTVWVSVSPNLSFEFLHLSFDLFYHGPIPLGFLVSVCLCVPYWPCCFSESQSPTICTFCARSLSLHHQGDLFGTSWERECHVEAVVLS